MPLSATSTQSQHGPQFAARARTREPLVTAAVLAIELSVSRDFVYEHADELGALRLGSGPKARLRFDVATAMACLGSEPSQSQNPSADGDLEQPPPRKRRSLATAGQKPGSILPLGPAPRRQKAGSR